MSISALDNPTDELVLAIQNHQKIIKKKLRAVKGSPNYRMGYGAYLQGFDPSKRDLDGYEEIYPGYAKGWKDAKRKESL